MLSDPQNTSIEQARRWVAACIAGEPPPLPATVAVTSIPALAEAEGVSALLSRHLGAGAGTSSGDAVLERLRAMELSRAALVLHRQEEVTHRLQMLKEAGLDCLLLKGEALAHSLYPEPHLRSRSDTDIMVSDVDAMERAWELFRAAGYTRKPTLQGRFTGFQFACRRELAEGVEIQFDIHREISDFTWFARRLPYAELVAHSEIIPIDGVAVRGLDRRYALLHACLHRVSNKPHGTQDRLAWLYDIHLLARANAVTPDRWQAFVSLARDKDMARVCLQGLEASQRYFDTGVDLTALAALARDEMTGLEAASTRWGLYMADWYCNPGLGNKLVQLREHLLPSPRYMRQKYRVRHTLQLPFYYLLRILRGLFRPGRAGRPRVCPARSGPM